MLVNIREKKKKRILPPKPFQFFFELLIHSSTVLKFLVFTGRYDLQTRSLTKHHHHPRIVEDFAHSGKDSQTTASRDTFGTAFYTQGFINLCRLSNVLGSKKNKQSISIFKAGTLKSLIQGFVNGISRIMQTGHTYSNAIHCRFSVEANQQDGTHFAPIRHDFKSLMHMF